MVKQNEIEEPIGGYPPFTTQKKIEQMGDVSEIKPRGFIKVGKMSIGQIITKNTSNIEDVI